MVVVLDVVFSRFSASDSIWIQTLGGNLRDLWLQVSVGRVVRWWIATTYPPAPAEFGSDLHK